MICKLCGIEFVGNSRHQRYCKRPECVKYRNREKSFRKKKDDKNQGYTFTQSFRQSECPVCKTIFTPSRSNQIYCRKDCSDYMVEMRKKEKIENKLMLTKKQRFMKKLGGLSPAESLAKKYNIPLE